VGGVVAVGWLNRDRIEAIWRKARVEVPVVAAPAEPEVTPEIAERAQRKLDALRKRDVDHIALSEQEVRSLLAHRYAQLLPAFVDSPRVDLEGSRIRLRARVPVDKLPRVSDLGEAAALLPDTAELDFTGQVLPLDSGRVALAVDEVSAAKIPLPKRLVPGALTRLGRKDEPGLPADAVALPLPPGAGAAYVRADSLVFLSRPAQRTGN
jgi:hypothetical protein